MPIRPQNGGYYNSFSNCWSQVTGKPRNPRERPAFSIHQLDNVKKN